MRNPNFSWLYPEDRKETRFCPYCQNEQKVIVKNCPVISWEGKQMMKKEVICDKCKKLLGIIV